MSNNTKTTLIVGSDSLIGKALFDYLKTAGEKVIGTTKRPEMISDTNLFLDLSDSPDKWNLPHQISDAVICAGITKLSACESESGLTSRINVHGTFKLMEALVSKGIYVIFFSTNQVFDGNLPYRKPDDDYSPVTEYGRQKTEVEILIKKLGAKVGVIRLTKVLGHSDPLLAEWARHLLAKKTIHPFSDMFISPVPLTCAVSILYMMIKLRFAGILQVSGEKDITYEEVARIGTKTLGISETLIKPHLAVNSGIFNELIPKNTTLDIEGLREAFGIVPPSVNWTIKKHFHLLNHLYKKSIT